VATWLLTITRNLAIDAVRVERVRPAHPVDVVDLTVVDPRAGPADIATRTTEVERVMRALLQLPIDQRRAVVLASVYGRTALEISEIEGIPLGTAKTRLRTGLLKLRGDLVPEVSP
jgi:RNA polymerase sigma-70 factor (ECF subfamily)